MTLGEKRERLHHPFCSIRRGNKRTDSDLLANNNNKKRTTLYIATDNGTKTIAQILDLYTELYSVCSKKNYHNIRNAKYNISWTKSNIRK